MLPERPGTAPVGRCKKNSKTGKKPETKLDHQEMRDILEDIARHSESAIARIQAIKVLRTLDAEMPSAGAFDELDNELATRRKQKEKAGNPV
jgi:hypothetical protein